MSTTIRKSSPATKFMWWFMTVCTMGIWALFVGYPK